MGGGADTLNFGGLAGASARDLDLRSSFSLALSAIKVNDLVSGTDMIHLTASIATFKAALSDVQLASIAALPVLLEAVALAANTAGPNPITPLPSGMAQTPIS